MALSSPQLHTRLALSGNQLKVIAAVSMVIDHVGFLFFPQVEFLRILGRFSFPLFAYMIAEGCRYTRHKGKHLLGIALLAALCQVVYYLFDGSTFQCILVTFTLAMVAIYALQNAKRALLTPGTSRVRRAGAVLLLALAIAVVYLLNQWLTIDYGFWGCMTPVFVSLFQRVPGASPSLLDKLDRVPIHVLMLGIVLLPVAAAMSSRQHFALLALPLLLLYSGARGKRKMKHFFYVFYPAHLALLQGLYFLLSA